MRHRQRWIWCFLLLLTWLTGSVSAFSSNPDRPTHVDQPVAEALLSANLHHVQERLSVGHMPVLISRPSVIGQRTRVVVLLHGFGPPSTPDQLAEAISLDGTDLIGVYVSLPLIGTRMPEGGVEALKRLQTNDFVNGLFYRSILGAAAELPLIVRFVAARYGLDASNEIGLFGFSAGGSAALLALTKTDLPVKSMVVVNAPQSVKQNVSAWEKDLHTTFHWDSASIQAARDFDVLAHARQISERRPRPAILFIQGNRDEHFGLAPVTQSAKALRGIYDQRGDTSKIQLLIVPGLRHNFGASQQRDPPLSDNTVIQSLTRDWLSKGLGKEFVTNQKIKN